MYSMIRDLFSPASEHRYLIEDERLQVSEEPKNQEG